LVVDICQVTLASAGCLRGCFVAQFDWYILIESVIESVLRCYDHLLGAYLERKCFTVGIEIPPVTFLSSGFIKSSFLAK